MKRDHQRPRQRDQMRRFGGESINYKRVVPDLGWRWWRAGRRLTAPAVQATKAELRRAAVQR